MIERLFRLIILLIFACHYPDLLNAQTDSLAQKLELEGDFRFRVEQDWNVRNPDGTFKEDRSRLRYRARIGLIYSHTDWSEFGVRLRTGNPIKQQDPQITLGDQFSGIPISFERAYAAFRAKRFSGWIGKNTFPFEKQNELFWSDNVFPEGIAAGVDLPLETKILDQLRINTGHFIFISDGGTFGNDSYIQGIQILSKWSDNRFLLFPGLFYFKRMPNIPDGNETYRLDYTIAHIGTRVNILKEPNWAVEVDYYHNLEDLSKNDSIPLEFIDQKKGITVSTRYGDLKSKGNWFYQISYNYQERYSAVDFLAQNDWARWDYSQQGSPDGRLTNYQGWEFLIAYAITPKMDLQLRGFFVEQLVPFGSFKETNNRIRFDINVRI